MNNKTALKQHTTLHFIFGPVITLFLFFVSLAQDPFFKNCTSVSLSALGAKL